MAGYFIRILTNPLAMVPLAKGGRRAATEVTPKAPRRTRYPVWLAEFLAAVLVLGSVPGDAVAASSSVSVTLTKG